MLSRTVCVLAIVLSIGGCVSKKVGSLTQYDPPHDISNSQERNRLTVAVEPWYEANRIKEHFGTNLLRSNVLPVFLKIQNDNPSGSYILLKDDCYLTDKEGASEIDKLRNEGKSPETGSKQMSAGFLLTAGSVILPALGAVGIPLVLEGGRQSANASIIIHNLKLNELQTATIRPGSSHQGFLYFQLPQEDRPQNIVINLQFQDLSNNNRVNFTFGVLSHLN